jgi:hypothetical protein
MNQKPVFLSDTHTRSFGGKLSGFESREEAIREKKHLKAYLKGKKTFVYGYKTIKLDVGELVEVESGFSFRQPAQYTVKEIWTPNN